MSEIGKFLLISGSILIALGLFFIVGPKIPGLGKLPGDMYIKKETFVFYFPIITCILISIILSLLWSLLRR